MYQGAITQNIVVYQSGEAIMKLIQNLICLILVRILQVYTVVVIWIVRKLRGKIAVRVLYPVNTEVYMALKVFKKVR